MPGISQLPVHGSTMHDDGENAMEKQWTEQDLHSFVQTAQAVFDSVSLTEEQPEPGWQDESLQVDYELRGGRVDCVLHRIVEADGKRWKLQMSAPLAGNVLPEERMTPRERELCRDDMSHDFLTGVYNRQYLERVFGAKLEQWARQGRSAAVALVAEVALAQQLRLELSVVGHRHDLFQRVLAHFGVLHHGFQEIEVVVFLVFHTKKSPFGT